MKADMKTNRRPSAAGGPSRQGGIVLVFAAVALFALLAMGALALDVGNMILNKGKLQNMVDAAALSAARTLDLGGDHALATSAANQALNNNLAQAGFSNMSLDGATVTVQFSDDLPFVPGGSASATYVRVFVSNVDLPEFFARLFPEIDEAVSASAVAGPSTALVGSCNMVPILLCGEKEIEPDENSGDAYGYVVGDVIALKYSSPDEEVGPGNFHLLRLSDDQGGSDARLALAGGYGECLGPPSGAIPTDTMLETEPGNKAGPAAQGINTRFNEYKGAGLNSSDYPPDCVVSNGGLPVFKVDKKTGALSPDPDKENLNKKYHLEYEKNESCIPNGVPRRREVIVPIGDCTNGVNGHGELRFLGLACMFLIQPVDQADAFIVAEYIKLCNAPAGTAGSKATTVGPHKIQLYRDNLSGDS